MVANVKSYIGECYREALVAWRRGAIAMTVIINVVLIGVLWLGRQLSHYPTAYFLVGTGIIAAFDVLIIFPYKLWAANSARIASLEDRLLPKIRLFLHRDPIQQTDGIEFATGNVGQSLPYAQVSAEPITEAPIDSPVANIVRIDHRATDTDEFAEVMGETEIAGWSRQPQNVRLAKGKPIRFNLFWYDQVGLHDASPMPSYKVEQAYARIGKSGEYRYRVHVDGRGIVPTEAYVYTRWRIRGHPVITLVPIAST
jgi:hypothetical protein